MPYLLDADVIIHALTGHERTVRMLAVLAEEGLAVSLATVGEVYEGAFRHANPQSHLDHFRRFLHPFSVVNLSEPIMERFAELRADLRRRGMLISDFDLILAATALDRNLTVLSFNVRHMQRIGDLRVHSPSP